MFSCQLVTIWEWSLKTNCIEIMVRIYEKTENGNNEEIVTDSSPLI